MKKYSLHTLMIMLTMALPWSLNAVDASGSSGEPLGGDELFGKWELKLVGEKGKHGQSPEDLSQTIELTLLREKKGKLQVVGSPFGWKIVKSKFSGKAGGLMKMEFEYEIGGKGYKIKFKGRVSEDGASVEDGEFDMIMGEGSFTAVKLANG